MARARGVTTERVKLVTTPPGGMTGGLKLAVKPTGRVLALSVIGPASDPVPEFFSATVKVAVSPELTVCAVLPARAKLKSGGVAGVPTVMLRGLDCAD